MLHKAVGMEYIKHVLAEQLIRNRRGHLVWTQKQRDNHYLDCEVYAAAAADAQWTPSLQSLAAAMD